MTRPHVAVIGAGLAGASTSFFLSLDGACDVTLLEREPLAGHHSSGRNAAMVRQVVADPGIAGFARDGARFIRSCAGEANGFSFHRSGSLLLAPRGGWPRLKAAAEAARSRGVDAEILTPGEAARLVPVLDPSRFEGAVHTPSDGVVDVANLLQLYLREGLARGVVHRFSREATGLLIEGGAVRGVATAEGPIAADAVVDAGGPWAGRLLPGKRRGELTPRRRHLFATGALAWVDREWPYVWDVERDVYFRPESGGLLLSPCDEEAWEPGIPETDPRATELLATKLAEAFPKLADVPIARSWAGLRTFTRERSFRIGPDAEIGRLFWAAGLGGHGVTCSAAVGVASASEVGERLFGRLPRWSFAEVLTAGRFPPA